MKGEFFGLKSGDPLCYSPSAFSNRKGLGASNAEQQSRLKQKRPRAAVKVQRMGFTAHQPVKELCGGESV